MKALIFMKLNIKANGAEKIGYPRLKSIIKSAEKYEITLKKIDSVGDNGGAFDLLDELLSSLEPSKEYLYKQRLKRKMQREAMR